MTQEERVVLLRKEIKQRTSGRYTDLEVDSMVDLCLSIPTTSDRTKGQKKPHLVPRGPPKDLVDRPVFRKRINTNNTAKNANPGAIKCVQIAAMISVGIIILVGYIVVHGIFALRST